MAGAAWVAAIVVAAPVLAYRYPPMYDLPNHEEIVAAMRHFGDAERYPPGLMMWSFGQPNQLFYFVAWAASFVLPVDMACKVVVALSVGAIPLGAAHLARHVGASAWSAVAVAPLALGFAFYFGFVGNLLGFAAFLALLPLFDAFARAATAAGAVGVTLALLVLYEAHESALVSGFLALGLFLVARPAAPRAWGYRLAPLVLVGALATGEHLHAGHVMGANLRALPPVIDLAAWQKLEGVPQALFGLHGRTTTLLPFGALAAVLALLAGERAWLSLPRPLPLRDWLHAPVPPLPALASRLRAWLHARRFEVLGVLLVALYFAAPFAFRGAMWLHARFLAPGVAVLAVALAPRRSPWWATRVATVASVAAAFAVVMPEFEATSRVYADLDPLLSRIAPGSAVASVDIVGGPVRGVVASVAGAAARAASERGGRMAVSFTQASPIPPVLIARAHRWDDALGRMGHGGAALEPAFDLARFRYVLAWTLPGQSERLRRALSPEAKLVATSGGWSLYESTLPLSPLTAPEPAPPPHAESLRDRFANQKD